MKIRLLEGTIGCWGSCQWWWRPPQCRSRWWWWWWWCRWWWRPPQCRCHHSWNFSRTRLEHSAGRLQDQEVAENDVFENIDQEGIGNDRKYRNAVKLTPSGGADIPCDSATLGKNKINIGFIITCLRDLHTNFSIIVPIMYHIFIPFDPRLSFAQCCWKECDRHICSMYSTHLLLFRQQILDSSYLVPIPPTEVITAWKQHERPSLVSVPKTSFWRSVYINLLTICSFPVIIFAKISKMKKLTWNPVFYFQR